MDRVRAFIAFPLPKTVRDLIREIRADVQAQGFRMRWVRPENIHLTLRFLGEICRTDIDPVAGAMGNAAADVSPFPLGAGGVGVFPGIRNPRVLWVGVRGDTPSLLRLRQDLDQHLEAVGFPAETRPFRAHLTIARIRGRLPDTEARQLARIMEKHTASESERFTATEMILYQSDLKPSGPVYTRLRGVMLAG
ncbi:2'-5' RNA ligase [Desulfonema ishimotonii]|uniref:RNA 2',3'-cyclic phosphodiesterase n=1 Tax=Desulfonema ishimotonii TaxID=45657 RepID=A0A401G081_9BACT|nr:RNA 2',3'-cyclic phosphodiesterase [Desulfonema ishimotonii]GBC62634.1 2'-5' RNA ligase [Desulfonema ishimotonii]